MASSTLENIADVPEWKKDYFTLRKVSKLFSVFYSLSVEGELPAERPCIILPTHQNSFDSIALMSSIEEYVAFVYAVSYKSKFLANLGVHINGIRVEGSQVYFKRFFSHLSNNSLIVAFPQGSGKIVKTGAQVRIQRGFQGNQVTSHKSGIAKLVQMYESSTGKRVAMVPTGIEYTFPKHLPNILPIPSVELPCLGSSVTIRFGEPKYLDGRSPEELTEIVMKEAARLSNIPWNVKTSDLYLENRKN